MSKIIIIHFSPLELYPPIQNLLLAFQNNLAGHTITVLTTHCTSVTLKTVVSDATQIEIIRLGRSGQKRSALIRGLNYISFYMSCVFLLIRYRPKRILYFETLSSFPVYIYRTILKACVEVYIHYHEYTSQDEYAKGMKLTRYFHSLEKKLYPIAKWVSHTNSYRMDMFVRDILPVTIPNVFILPNYPPRLWFKEVKTTVKLPLKIVYSGALSMETMYTKEFSEWVISQKGAVHWDIYSYNFTADVRLYLTSLNSTYITLKPGVNYNELPEILKQYTTGVILYKGHIPNYIYNAPNKLFEYLSCGLDVWFPDVMTGSMRYAASSSLPRVIPLDFSRLTMFNLNDTLERIDMPIRPERYCSEDVLTEIIDKLIRHD